MVLASKSLRLFKKRNLQDLEDLDIEDAGVCGLDLLNLLDGARKVIIVDAILADSPAGSVHRIEGRDLLKGTEFHPLALGSRSDNYRCIEDWRTGPNSPGNCCHWDRNRSYGH